MQPKDTGRGSKPGVKDYSGILATQLILLRLPDPVREYRFHPVRKWLIDLAWPTYRLAVEVEGGIWIRGRHTRPTGFLNDLEKYNELTLLDWSLLRVTTQQVRNGKAGELIARWFHVNTTP